MTEAEPMAECQSCGEEYPYEELDPDNSIVATCPNCKGHRFRPANR